MAKLLHRPMTRPACDLGTEWPATQSASITYDATPVLVWAHSGRGCVEVDGLLHHLGPGQGYWIPPRTPHRVETGPNAIIIPIRFPARDLADHLTDAAPVDVGPGWEHWLTYEFARSLRYLRGSSAPIDGVVAALQVAEPSPSVSSSPLARPALPRSTAARRVAEALLANPANPAELTAWSARVGVSPRTLQRQFTHETGHPFGQWRTQLRLALAADALAEGRAVGWVAQSVGFGTASGFCRAFRRESGRCPSELQGAPHPRVVRPGLPTPPPRLTLAAPSGGHRPIPSNSTGRRVTGRHVAIWVYRGSARLAIGHRSLRLGQNDLTWLPAGIPHRLDIDPDSLALPVGVRPSDRSVRAEEVTVVPIPDRMRGLMLRTAVVAAATRRPTLPSDPVDAFLPEIRRRTGHEAVSKTEAAAARQVAETLHANPGDQRSLRQWAAELNVAVDGLHRAIRAETGASLPQWRTRVRMMRAGMLLGDGVAPNVVARRLGYAHLSGFTKTFTATYGASPRAFQRAELGAR